MRKIVVHYFDTNVDDVELLNHSSAFGDDINSKEKLVSEYFKEKYVGDYYLNERGKPLSDKKFFNIAHSKGVVIYAESDVPLGVDIEVDRDIKEDLKRYISSDEEFEYIKSKREGFFEVWTAKEALAKCEGSGVVTKMDKIPSLPINGTKEYMGDAYMTKCIRFKNSLICVCVKTIDDFGVDVVEEKTLVTK